jgi:hypothetical protein
MEKTKNLENLLPEKAKSGKPIAGKSKIWKIWQRV